MHSTGFVLSPSVTWKMLGFFFYYIHYSFSSVFNPLSSGWYKISNLWFGAFFLSLHVAYVLCTVVREKCPHILHSLVFYVKDPDGAVWKVWAVLQFTEYFSFLNCQIRYNAQRNISMSKHLLTILSPYWKKTSPIHNYIFTSFYSIFPQLLLKYYFKKRKNVHWHKIWMRIKVQW